MEYAVPDSRRAPTIHLIPCILKLFLSFVIVISVIVGYALSFKVVKFGPVSLGLYGLILLIDFLIQFSCALLNRRSVNNIAAAAHFADSEKAYSPSGPRADISIAVVGYREDDEAWRRCLRSLQQQTLRPRAFVAVVDGNDWEDMPMADAFATEFRDQNATIIHLPVLLSSIYRKIYHDSLLASGEPAPGHLVTFWRWLRNSRTNGELNALRAARERIIQEVLAWEAKYSISDYSAVCFTQPHGHKRVSMSCSPF
jgi:hyaluronan synthase